MMMELERSLKSLLVALSLGFLAGLPVMAQDHGHEISVGALTIVHPWAARASGN